MATKDGAHKSHLRCIVGQNSDTPVYVPVPLIMEKFVGEHGADVPVEEVMVEPLGHTNDVNESLQCRYLCTTLIQMF